MNNIKNEPVGLNYLGFLSTPPTSGRAEQLSNRNMGGGCTTRRSLTKPPQTTFNGIYEGDFTMMTDSMMSDVVHKPLTYKQQQHQQQQQQIIKAHNFIGDSLDLSLEQHEDHLEDEVDEEIRGKTFQNVYTEKATAKKKKIKNLWEEYKSYIFTKEQCEKIESKIEIMKQNPIICKLMFAVWFITVITIWILNVLLRGILMPFIDFICATVRGRSILRSSTRRLLWYMTLAKCGDLQLYGLIVVLSPLLFLSAFMGLIVTLYCEIKNGIFTFISYVRFRLDVEPPKFD